MSLQDTVTKQYVSDPKVFADAFNYLIYNGEQVIRPEQLTDLDATQFAIPYREEEEGKPEATQKYRDVLKTLAVKTDERLHLSWCWALKTRPMCITRCLCATCCMMPCSMKNRYASWRQRTARSTMPQHPMSIFPA